MKVRFGVFPNITHAPGSRRRSQTAACFKKLLPNATIEVHAVQLGHQAIEAMFSDAIDITYIGPNPAINALREVRRARPCGSSPARPPAARSSSSSRTSTRAADLKGKTLATPALGNTQDVALRAWLKEKGLTTDTAGGGDVSIVPQENAADARRPSSTGDDRRRLGARAVGDPAGRTRAAARSSSTSATCGPTASTSRPT